jgi:hypothetical protein
MNDAIVSWSKALTGAITGYAVVWTQNGNPLPAVVVPATAQQDAQGYSSDFTTATGVTPKPGDVLGASVATLDATDSLESAVVASTPATVTIPLPPPVAPGVPQNVTLALS